jgi:hypothetical protein
MVAVQEKVPDVTTLLKSKNAIGHYVGIGQTLA